MIIGEERLNAPPGLGAVAAVVVASEIGSVSCGVAGCERVGGGELNTAFGAGNSSIITLMGGFGVCVRCCLTAATRFAAKPFRRADAEVTTAGEDCEDRGVGIEDGVVVDAFTILLGRLGIVELLLLLLLIFK
jgi:hypothetical protein